MTRSQWAALLFLITVTAAAMTATWVAPFGFEEQFLDHRLESPSHQFFFGTDTLGRDLYSRIIYGAQMSLAVGFVSGLLSLFVGVTVGLIAGYFGGWIDTVLMRLTELLISLPTLLIAVLMTMIVGRGFWGLVAAISIGSWFVPARLIRGLTARYRRSQLVSAERALGASHLRILGRHVLPLIAGPIIVTLLFQIPTHILAESFLSFVGLGLEPPYASWGTLAADGFRAMHSYPHLIVFPGVVLFLTLLSINLLGDELRRRFFPVMSHS